MPLPASPKVPGDILSDYASRNDAELSAPPERKPAAKKVKAAPKPKAAAAKAAPKAAAAKSAPAGKAPAKAAAAKKSPAKKDAAHTAPAGFSPLAQPAPQPRPLPVSRKGRALVDAALPKLFALDTNVLLHDPACLFRFEEHDVFLPMTALEELDRHKTGMSDVARNARQVSRTIDQLMEASGFPPPGEGLALDALGNREAKGRLYCQAKSYSELAELPGYFSSDGGDNDILRTVAGLAAERRDRAVVLVSKDINMRIKAATLGLPAEDYFNDKAIDDTDLLYTGKFLLPANFWETHGKDLKSWQKDGYTWYRVKGPLVPGMFVNELVYSESDKGGFEGIVSSVDHDEAVLRSLRSFSSPKNSVWGICARNPEQNFALNLLMNPEIDFVTLLGQAGTGKTLLTLAAALSQTLDERRYNEIIFTRATVSVGEDIGFLPGTEEEKMTPWMGALEDNLEVLNHTDQSIGSWGREAAADLIKSRIRVKSMSFMRGRTFMNRFLIIDEAQNLSPKQMKTLITRAGPGTKIVCMGNIAQIDTPYLTEGSSGLTYVVDKFKGWAHSGHITLQRGERSRLADFASEVL